MANIVWKKRHYLFTYIFFSTVIFTKQLKCTLYSWFITREQIIQYCPHICLSIQTPVHSYRSATYHYLKTIMHWHYSSIVPGSNAFMQVTSLLSLDSTLFKYIDLRGNALIQVLSSVIMHPYRLVLYFYLPQHYSSVVPGSNVLIQACYLPLFALMLLRYCPR